MRALLRFARSHFQASVMLVCRCCMRAFDIAVSVCCTGERHHHRSVGLDVKSVVVRNQRQMLGRRRCCGRVRCVM